MRLCACSLAVSAMLSAANPGTSLRSDSTTVLINATVRDRDGRMVTHLTASDFEVRDEKNPVEVTQAVLEDAPVSTVVLLDASRSMRFDFAHVMASLRRFLDSRGPGDDFCVLTFAERTAGECRFSSRPDLPSVRPGGDTALLDALAHAMQVAKSAPNQRRAVLVLSDSVDNASRTTWAQARAMAVEFNGTVYAIAPPLYDPDAVADEKRLQNLAELTGGRMFRLRGAGDLGPTLDSLDLRQQYVLGFGVPRGMRDGRYHRVSVKLRHAANMRVDWRRGYLAPKEGR